MYWVHTRSVECLANAMQPDVSTPQHASLFHSASGGFNFNGNVATGIARGTLPGLDCAEVADVSLATFRHNGQEDRQ